MVSFQTKNPNLSEYWRLENVDMYILWTFGIFYGHLANFMTLWNMLCSSDAFFPLLVSCTKKILATLNEISLWWRRTAESIRQQ
jgi:hypothetical protein